jgi:hypothetical protein
MPNRVALTGGRGRPGRLFPANHRLVDVFGGVWPPVPMSLFVLDPDLGVPRFAEHAEPTNRHGGPHRAVGRGRDDPQQNQ